MQIETIDRWPSDGASRDALRIRWNRLLERAEWATVFQSFEWHDAWWSCFGERHRLQLLTVTDETGELLAIAPLMVVGRRRLMLVGTSNHASDYADFIVARGHWRARAALVERVAADRRGWREMELRNLPAGSPTPALFAGCDGLPRPLLQFAAEAPARRLVDPAADRRAANKKSLRRHLNGFAREAPVELRRITDPETIAGHLDAFFAQHRLRWACSSTPSLFVDPAQQAFYRALAERFAGTGELHFSAVVWQERAIAYHFGFEHHGVFTWYKPSYDPALEQRSPGEVLIKLLLEDAVSRGLDEFDFTVGSEPFKFRFANVVRRVYRVRIYRHAWQRWPAVARDRLKQWVLALRERRLRSSRSTGRSAAGTPPAHSA